MCVCVNLCARGKLWERKKLKNVKYIYQHVLHLQTNTHTNKIETRKERHIFSDRQQTGGPVTSTSPYSLNSQPCSTPSGFPPGLSRIPLLGVRRGSRRHIKLSCSLIPSYTNNWIPQNKYRVIAGTSPSNIIIWSQSCWKCSLWNSKSG